MSQQIQDFVYITYIQTTPERLWEALTTPEFTRQYWFNIDVTSDWKVGSPVSYMRDGQAKMNGKVLIADRPNVLSYTFRDAQGEASHEPPTKVVLKIERQPDSDVCKLTVTHSDFVENSKHRPAISQGWPMVLSGLKTFLETKSELQISGCNNK